MFKVNHKESLEFHTIKYKVNFLIKHSKNELNL